MLLGVCVSSECPMWRRSLRSVEVEDTPPDSLTIADWIALCERKLDLPLQVAKRASVGVVETLADETHRVMLNISPPAKDDSISVKVETVFGRPLHFTVESAETVASVKLRIYESELKRFSWVHGLSPGQLQLSDGTDKSIVYEDNFVVGYKSTGTNRICTARFMAGPRILNCSADVKVRPAFCCVLRGPPVQNPHFSKDRRSYPLISLVPDPLGLALKAMITKTVLWRGFLTKQLEPEMDVRVSEMPHWSLRLLPVDVAGWDVDGGAYGSPADGVNNLFFSDDLQVRIIIEEDPSTQEKMEYKAMVNFMNLEIDSLGKQSGFKVDFTRLSIMWKPLGAHACFGTTCILSHFIGGWVPGSVVEVQCGLATIDQSKEPFDIFTYRLYVLA